MASRDVLKVSALHSKDPSKTDEEFGKHVTENINPAWVKLVKRHEVMKYSIVSVTRLLRSLVHNYAMSEARLHWCVAESNLNRSVRPFAQAKSPRLFP